MLPIKKGIQRKERRIIRYALAYLLLHLDFDQVVRQLSWTPVTLRPHPIL